MNVIIVSGSPPPAPPRPTHRLTEDRVDELVRRGLQPAARHARRGVVVLKVVENLAQGRRQVRNLGLELGIGLRSECRSVRGAVAMAVAVFETLLLLLQQLLLPKAVLAWRSHPRNVLPLADPLPTPLPASPSPASALPPVTCRSSCAVHLLTSPSTNATSRISASRLCSRLRCRCTQGDAYIFCLPAACLDSKSPCRSCPTRCCCLPPCAVAAR